MKKLILISMVIMCFQISSWAQNTQVVFSRSGNYYSVYFPNGFYTTESGIGWTGQAIANRISFQDSIDFVGDNPEIFSKYCATAKSEAKNANQLNEVKCGPQAKNAQSTGFSNEFYCFNTDPNTCMVKARMEDGNFLYFWGGFDTGPIPMDENNYGLDVVVFIENN